MPPSSTFAPKLIARLQDVSCNASQTSNTPICHTNNAAGRSAVISQSRPLSLRLGTGASIYSNALIPAILSAKSEIILVTCFWAPSRTLTSLSEALTALAAQRCATIERLRHGGTPPSTTGSVPPLQVSICLSSRSFFQRLFHPCSADGYRYTPMMWSEKLGLPDQRILEAGAIDLSVKSLFFLPFSVMHPKFLIVDRQRAIIPSCNVSWEPWLEGCVEIDGDAVQGLLAIYNHVWERGPQRQLPRTRQETAPDIYPGFPDERKVISSAADAVREHPAPEKIPTILLPSCHHRNPRFRPFPWQSHPRAPQTPLNIALLELFESAQRNIYIQTPNLTSPPVLSSLLDAIKRGVDVRIVTGRNMMVIEQLLTAGTTTAWCVRSLVRQYTAMQSRPRNTHSPTRRTGATNQIVDVESQSALGSLQIAYFHRRIPTSFEARSEEPVHTHIKLTIVDDEYTMLGSGNMDRASWYTSQELGVLFRSTEFAEITREALEEVLQHRLNIVFDSGAVS